MNVVSEIWTWTEGCRLYSRLTTNVPGRRLLAKLSTLGLLNRAETIHPYFDDRVYGGNGFEILWKECTQMTDLANLARL
jgi:hypothetical protein